jgi:hypothetical protein
MSMRWCQRNDDRDDVREMWTKGDGEMMSESDIKEMISRR